MDCFERYLKKYTDNRLWNKSIAFGLASVILVAIFFIIAIVHYYSETYLRETILRSLFFPLPHRRRVGKYLAGFPYIAILPNEFEKDSKRVKEQIKKSKAILKERKKEAKNKGQYATDNTVSTRFTSAGFYGKSLRKWSPLLK
jgi:hypothetical protein